MFTVTVEHSFAAEHHVLMPDGTWELPHAHHWHVRAFFRSQKLDRFAMVVDFVAVQGALTETLDVLNHTDLNTNPALSGAIPTAEVVAQFVLHAIQRAGWSTIYKVEVTEAPGCVAAYQVDEHAESADRP